jgi:hypothetical protein
MREVVGIVKSKGRASGQFYNQELTMINHKSLSRTRQRKEIVGPLKRYVNSRRKHRPE